MLHPCGLQISNDWIFGHPDGMTGQNQDKRNGRLQQGCITLQNTNKASYQCAT
jgi:hypothetical protein